MEYLPHPPPEDNPIPKVSTVFLTNLGAQSGVAAALQSLDQGRVDIMRHAMEKMTRDLMDTQSRMIIKMMLTQSRLQKTPAKVEYRGNQLIVYCFVNDACDRCRYRQSFALCNRDRGVDVDELEANNIDPDYAAETGS